MITEIAWSEQSFWPVLAGLQSFPLLAALLLSRVRQDWPAFWLGMLLAFVEFVGAVTLFQLYDPLRPEWQLVERLTLLGPLQYHVAVDGMSVLFILLTAFLTLMAIPYGWVRPFRPQPRFLVLLFCGESLLISQFATVDLLWFFLCSLIQIGLVGYLMRHWSASLDEGVSLNRFFEFMGIGLAMLLAATLILGWSHFDQTGRWSFDLLDLLAHPVHSFLSVSVFFLLFYGLGIRVPLFPLHGWLPLVAERGTVVLALVFLLGVKTGFYGMLRFMFPLVPASIYRWQLAVVIIATIGIFYAAWLATMQQNLRRMMAYAVISHSDIIVIGLFTTNSHAFQGSLLLIGNVGLAAATLFFMIGLINRRTKTVLLGQLGGLFGRLPFIAMAFFVAGLSVIGMPGTPGFDATHLLMEAAMHRYGALITIAAALGNVASAAFLLWSFQRVFLAAPGQRPIPLPKVRQTEWIEGILAVTLIVVQLTAGFYAEPWLKLLDTTAHSMAKPYSLFLDDSPARHN
ncbi:complex I subunit 4 family protein [Candidatus Magnetaquicoccus inordinatus]|uniref:complex I subunit 4 family protein n=1 Tax=Candidatus Magnetaquicoccus inordinatus TaxID=2496818 RepID=UPI00102AE0C1|nr:NADH-quinone oxidoreductase subunit M [Candidatus Magnetaquicoccus inordinatus]